MESLIHDLLELARHRRVGRAAGAGRSARGAAPARRGAQAAPRAAGIDLVLPTGLMSRMYCDRSRMYQVFSNLIGNAIDHMGPRRDARIEVSIDEDDSQHEIVVSDNGRGVDPAHRDRIFEVFQSIGTRSDGRRGTGMGLAIVKKIVEKARRPRLARERARLRRALPRHAAAPLVAPVRRELVAGRGPPVGSRADVPGVVPIGNFPISTFGLMMATAFLVGSWITARRMKEVGLDPDLATTLLVYVMLGGILGSKLYFAIDVSIREGRPFADLLFARDGITWYGGLILGTVIGSIGARSTACRSCR
jgi:hypothetical protein